MKLHYLQRWEDVSGLSGTGIVGEICEYSDGRCVMRWVATHEDGTPMPRSIVIYDNMADLIAIHGHGGASEVVAA